VPHNQLHATCVSVDGKGILILGPSGSGKSDLALRLIDGGAVLVADDRVDISRQEEALIASAPANLGGMLEVRGIGIVRLPHSEQVSLRLMVELVGRDEVERMPEARFWDCLGLQLPLLSLNAFEHSVCAKIRVYVRNL
jgi:serine kinase of HPr protein (carbohydrate metabolism regulator)